MAWEVRSLKSAHEWCDAIGSRPATMSGAGRVTDPHGKVIIASMLYAKEKRAFGPFFAVFRLSLLVRQAEMLQRGASTCRLCVGHRHHGQLAIGPVDARYLEYFLLWGGARLGKGLNH